MVKITNTLGDVKIGRQGEVVYQRKYGEQIRRTAAPKRAIPSQRQTEHRQLYRAALDWRSGLSLANRRYLDGYCIANGVVDSYHLPLPWSRFALKIYLQHVKFVSITKPIPGEAGQETLYENYQYVVFMKWSFSKLIWMAQTFTPLVSHKVTKVAMYISRYYNPGASRISIRATDGEGKPTGGDLTGVDFDANQLPNGDPAAFIYFDLPQYQLLADTMYAMVIRAPNATGAASITLAASSTPPLYPRGCLPRSTDSGNTWTLFEGIDAYFEEYGIGPPSPPTPGLLHVRHPALLRVVQKRGELTVNGYDTLSSLDDEYLTGQVGLDVQKGDIIEATTLPGINYTHPIL